MRGPTWPIVVIVFIVVAAAVTLYVLVEPNDPMRAVIITAVNAAIGAVTVYFLGARQQKTDAKVDALVEATNGHDERPPSDGRPGATSPR